MSAEARRLCALTGIVKDFNLHSIRSDIPPLEINLTDKYIDQVAVHYKQGTLKSILPLLESEWKKAAPDRTFSYITIEELIQSLYSSEKNLTTIVSIFALFTLLIAAFGLFGLTKWLSNFAFKVNINWWFFAEAFIVAAFVVLSTVFFHSYKASRLNPVNVLRYE